MKVALQKNNKRTRKRAVQNPTKKNTNDLTLALYELLQGKREFVRIYSNTLQSDLCFVNTNKLDSATLTIDCPIYTTKELAYIITLSKEDFLRFHYLKTRLVG
jgi:hypothetical protein